MRQAVVPEAIRGRVLATMRLFSWGSMSIGAVLGGVVGQALGVDWAAIIGCAAIVVTGLALAPFLRTDAIRRLREANASAGGSTTAG
jgi:MFS family permease